MKIAETDDLPEFWYDSQSFRPSDESLVFYRIPFGLVMTQDEKWLTRYNEVKSFIESNHRNPSKYAPEEMLMVHFLKRCRKLMNAEELKEPRLSMFKELMKLSKKYKRKNQYE